MEFEVLSATVTVPAIEGKAPGPIHTVVSDPDGNLYYSDEINHRVVSTDPEGRLRWHRGGNGSQEGHFRYPKGLAPGYLTRAGRRTACVAVCDSWNRRVRVIGHNGDMQADLCGSGSGEFQEVVDIRFLAPGLDEGTGPNTWLILDRCAHQIRLYADTAEPLGAIGSALPAHLEKSWAQKLIGSITAVATLSGNEAGLRFDPAYYPARLFGDTPDALILWEPLARQLKQIVGRNLLPLGRFPDPPWECVDADRTGYLCWARADGRAAAFSYDGKVKWVAECPGRPISTAGAEGQVWFQDGRRLVRLRWHEPDGSVRPKRFRSPLRENVVQELEQMQTSADLQESASQLLQAIDRAIGQCRDLWHARCEENAEFNNSESRVAEIAEAEETLRRRADGLDRYLSRHSMTLLKVLCLKQAEGSSEDPGWVPELSGLWKQLFDSLGRRFSEAQKLRDQISIGRLDSHVPGLLAPKELVQLLEDNVENVLQRVAALRQTASRYLSLPSLPGTTAGRNSSA